MVYLRRPTISDVPAIVALLAPAVRAEHLLPRTPRDVVERIREYWVATEDEVVVGVGSLALVDFYLAEIGVLCAREPAVEALLLDALLQDARALGVGRAFVLTHDPQAFERRGFLRTSLDALPEKRDRQCAHCPRVGWCRQVALEVALEAPYAAAAK